MPEPRFKSGASTIQDAMASGDPVAASEAIQEIDQRLQRSTDSKERATLLLNKAVFCGIVRRFDDSRRQLELALGEAPTDPDVHLQHDFIRATLYDQEGKPEEAYRHLTEFLSTHRERLRQPDSQFLYQDLQLRRGLDAASIGSFEEAVSLLLECLSFDLKPDDRSNVLASLGLCYAELKNYESAMHCLLEAHKIGFTKEWEGQGHFYLAMSYAHLHFFQEAKVQFQICEEHIREYGFPPERIYGWLSWVCKGLGQTTESERYARLTRLT